MSGRRHIDPKGLVKAPVRNCLQKVNLSLEFPNRIQSGDGLPELRFGFLKGQ